MRDESKNVELSTARRTHPALAIVVDRATWRAKRDALLVREEAHLREGNAIAAAHRRLPIVQMDPAISVIGVSVRTAPGTPRECSVQLAEHPTVSVGDPPAPSIAEPADAAKWCA
jgi:hypothetical protein